MKLASALKERADIQKRMIELRTRLSNNAKTQEGEEPAEKPEDLLKELDSLTKRFEVILSAVNLKNSTTSVDGVTVTELLAHRDSLKMKVNTLRDFLNEASEKCDRFSHTEIRIVSTVNVADLQKNLDLLSKELRETDERIQEINWTTDIDI